MSVAQSQNSIRQSMSTAKAIETDPFIHRYGDWRRSVSASAIARHWTLSGLAGLYRATGQLSALLSKPRVQFLYMHWVFEDQKTALRNLLDSLSREHRFISYSQAVNKILTGEIDAPYVSLSFDDGLKSCFDVSSILREFGISACYFICPSIIGDGNFDNIRRFCAERIHMPPVQIMSWTDVTALLDQGHEVGSHTLNHSNLAAVSSNQVHDEICGSFDAIRQKIGAPKHFSWPFGRFFHFTREAARTVFEAGYESCASAERGCHEAAKIDRSSLCLRRDHVKVTWPQQHVRYFLAKNAQRMTTAGNRWPEALQPALLSQQEQKRV